MAERPRYLRAAEIADIVGVSVRTVRRWMSGGILRSVKVGGARLVAEADLLQLLHPQNKSAG
jgi:excisionase family DNA binding protein